MVITTKAAQLSCWAKCEQIFFLGVCVWGGGWGGRDLQDTIHTKYTDNSLIALRPRVHLIIHVPSIHLFYHTAIYTQHSHVSYSSSLELRPSATSTKYVNEFILCVLHTTCTGCLHRPVHSMGHTEPFIMCCAMFASHSRVGEFNPTSDVNGLTSLALPSLLSPDLLKQDKRGMEDDRNSNRSSEVWEASIFRFFGIMRTQALAP